MVSITKNVLSKKPNKDDDSLYSLLKEENDDLKELYDFIKTKRLYEPGVKERSELIHLVPGYEDIRYLLDTESLTSKIQDNSVDFLKARKEAIQKTERPTIMNLMNQLTFEKTNQIVFFKDNRYGAIVFCFFLSLFRILCCLPVIVFLQSVYENADCFLFESGGENCALKSNKFIFRVSMNIVTLIASLFLLYDLAPGVSTALPGNQTFDERTKFTSIMKLINFSGRFDLFCLRFLIFFALLINSLYEFDGTRGHPFHLDKLALYLFNADYSDVRAVLRTITDPKMYFLYAFVLMAFSVSRLLVTHPFTTHILKSKKKKNSVGEISKIATFILTLNMILKCYLVALLLGKIFDCIKSDSFDFGKSQLFIVTILVQAFLSVKYSTSVLDNRSSLKVSTLYMMYLPCDVFVGSLCGLENENDLIQKIIQYFILGLTGINVLYIASYTLKTIRKIILLVMNLFIKKRKITFVLNSVSVILNTFATVLLTQEMFKFIYEFEENPTGYIPLENLSKASFNHILYFQLVFSLIPIATVFCNIYEILFDLKYILTLKERFWIAIYFLLLNISNLLGFAFIGNFLEVLEHFRFANIVINVTEMENFQKVMLFIIAGTTAHILSIVIGLSHPNETYEPVQNPSFESSTIRNSIHTTKEVDLVELENKRQKLSNKLPDNLKEHFFSSVFFIALFVLFLIFLYPQAVNEEWIRILPVQRDLSLDLSETVDNGFHCPANYSAIPELVKALKESLFITSQPPINSNELIEKGLRGLVISYVPVTAVIAIASFALYFMDSMIVDPVKMVMGTTALAIPSVLALISTPSLVDYSTISLMVEIQIGRGFYCALLLFFGYVIFIFSVIMEKAPIESLYVNENEIDDLRTKEAIEQ